MRCISLLIPEAIPSVASLSDEAAGDALVFSAAPSLKSSLLLGTNASDLLQWFASSWIEVPGLDT